MVQNSKDKENMLTVIDLKEGARGENLEQFLENCLILAMAHHCRYSNCTVDSNIHKNIHTYLKHRKCEIGYKETDNYALKSIKTELMDLQICCKSTTISTFGF